LESKVEKKDQRTGSVYTLPVFYLCQDPGTRNTKFLLFPRGYDTLGGVRDRESTAITITLPRALDRALQALADQKHCGNKSAAIREVLDKEAGMKAKLRMSEEMDNAAIEKAERRAVKYGSRKRRSRKTRVTARTLMLG
jgi:Arc/MetJ-type ribon-helix-helix transcriptional regulator